MGGIRNNRGDVSSLSGLTSSVTGLRNRPRQSILAPTTGPANTLLQGLRKGGNAKSVAQSLTEAFGMNADAAATAVASAATEGGPSMSVAEAVAQTALSAPNVAAGRCLWVLCVCVAQAIRHLLTPSSPHLHATDAFTVFILPQHMHNGVLSGSNATLPGGVVNVCTEAVCAIDSYQQLTLLNVLLSHRLS